ncbi:MAG: hypothetical protein VR72_16615 [Clostridiaceae bacterium BRH_c20a]|nr:MAG: hypothetical protein VR72_16615 [Clostridiaceae bacterium BRH_c20a]
MLRKTLIILLLFIIMSFTSGCWDVQEISRRGIASTVFFDSGKTSSVKIGIVIPVPGTQIPPVQGTTQQFQKRHFIILGEGKSALEAWTKVHSNVATDIFFGQIRAIILSEEVARGNINDVLDFVGRFPLIPPNTNVLLTKNDPEKLLDLKNEANLLPGNYIDFYFQIPGKRTLALPLDLWRVNSIVDKKWQDSYLPIIEQSQDNYRIAGTAVFSENSMVGELDMDETQTLALIMGSDLGYLTLPLNDVKLVAFHKIKSQTKTEITVSDTGIVTFDVKLKITGGVVESKPQRIISKDETERIENEAETLTKRKIEALLTKLQGLNSDPVGFGGKYRIKYPRQWANIDWHQVYPVAIINVHTKFSIKSTGLFK